MLSRDPRMRYWKPTAALAPFVSGYHLYAVPGGNPLPEDVFFPSWANLRFLLTPESLWQVRPRGSDWVAVEGATLFGPTDSVLWSRSSAGLVVGVGLRPLGIYHLFREPAEAWANRVAPAADALRFDVAALHAAFLATTDDEDVPGLFDAALGRAIVPDAVRDPAIATIERGLADEDTVSVEDLSRTTGIPTRSLQRLCDRAFGFGPRMLLRRTRFLRSFDAIRQVPRGERTLGIDRRYVDYSHFLKDARYFLGMTPEEFLGLDTPLARQSMVLRTAALGEPMQGLSDPRRVD